MPTRNIKGLRQNEAVSPFFFVLTIGTYFVFCIENEKLIDVIKHPNQEKYKGQKFYVIDIDNYAFIVPYVEEEQGIFLKTILA